MTRAPRDIGASVRDRLYDLARARGDDFQLLLTRYANERLLYRLAVSEHGARFVLKGAALFTLWTGKPHRATRDLDLLGFGNPGEEHLRAIFADIIAIKVADDGVLFDPASLEVAPIRAGQEYGGARIEFGGHIASAKVRLQIDVGFGDAITPGAVLVDFPALLDFPAPRIRAYPRETVVAEKLDAMVQLGMANTRMKDFYDLVILSRMFEFDGAVLVRAVRATFERRGTSLPEGLPVALTSAFATDPLKNTQWTAFARKSGASDAGDLASACAAITRFVALPLASAAGGGRWRAVWPAGGPWAEA